MLLTFSKAMASPSGAESEFAVAIDSVASSVSGVSLGSDTAQLLLTLGTKVANGDQSVTVAYTKGTAAVKAADGGVLASFTATAVTNGLDKPQAAPIGLTAVSPTTYGGDDGRITGVTTEMEYAVSSSVTPSYKAVTGDTINGLTPGSYVVRYAAKTGYSASSDAVVEVPLGHIGIVSLVESDHYVLMTNAGTTSLSRDDSPDYRYGDIVYITAISEGTSSVKETPDANNLVVSSYQSGSFTASGTTYTVSSACRFYQVLGAGDHGEVGGLRAGETISLCQNSAGVYIVLITLPSPDYTAPKLAYVINSYPTAGTDGGTTVYSYTVYVNGALTTLESLSNNLFPTAGLWRYETSADSYVTSATQTTADGIYAPVSGGTLSAIASDGIGFTYLDGSSQTHTVRATQSTRYFRVKDAALSIPSIEDFDPTDLSGTNIKCTVLYYALDDFGTATQVYVSITA